MNGELVTTLVVALLTSSVVAAIIDWIKTARKIKADVGNVNVSTSIALMEKLQEELERAEARIKRLEEQLTEALTELEDARQLIAKIDQRRKER